VGISEHSEVKPSAKECLELCDATFSCRWFTFYSSYSDCVLFKSCPTIDASCEDCISGERRCIDQTTTTSETPTSTATATYETSTATASYETPTSTATFETPTATPPETTSHMPKGLILLYYELTWMFKQGC
jgi:hypothetical protein